MKMFEKICKDLKRKAKLKFQNVDLSSSSGCGYFMTWVPMHQDHHKHHSKKKKTHRVERYKTNWDYDQIPILFYQEQTIQKVAQTLRKSRLGQNPNLTCFLGLIYTFKEQDQ